LRAVTRVNPFFEAASYAERRCEFRGNQKKFPLPPTSARLAKYVLKPSIENALPTAAQKPSGRKGCG
jgi:hypothetical protein